MSLTSCARRRLPALRCLHSRNVSSAPQTKAKPSVNVQTHISLPPAKMRALIALYHQSENWITEENLMERIDQTFLPDRENTAIDSSNESKPRNIPYEDIDRMKKAMLAAPKMAPWDINAGAALNPTRKDSNEVNSWSNSRALRENKVIEALYGVVVNGAEMLPGLEVVREAEQTIRHHREIDEEQKRLQAKEDPIFENEMEAVGKALRQ